MKDITITRAGDKEVDQKVFHLKSTTGDYTRHLRGVLKSLPVDAACTLVFEKAEYHFYDDDATELFCYVSNNSEGLKRIAFPLIGHKGLTIDGQGAKFIFHGRICPFLVRDCADITLRNFTIDYDRPFVSQGLIEDVCASGVKIRMDETCPYYFHGGRIWFNGDNYHQHGFDTGKIFKRDSFLHCLEFDTEKRETAYMVRDNFEVAASAVTEVEAGLLHLDTAYPLPLPTVGNTLVVSHDHRDCFGICLDQSDHISIEDVTLNHTGAMGFIAQRSDTITLKNCTVAPEAGSGRMVSSFADASHFVNCRGQIRVLGCRFENMLDDPINVHGIYTPITRIIDSHTLEIANGHYEQAGIQVVDADTEVAFIDQTSLLTLSRGRVKTIEPINRFRWRVELSEPLPAGIKVGDCLESCHWVPDLEIRDCTFGKNRARGPLVTTAGKVRIENNHFHHAGSAIKISGDSNDWFESGAVRDVLIQGNVFDNCGYGTWGQGIVAIDPEIKKSGFRPEAYHRNIRIIANEFRTFHEELIYARCVDGLTIDGNRVEKTNVYPSKSVAFKGLMTENCMNVQSDL